MRLRAPLYFLLSLVLLLPGIVSASTLSYTGNLDPTNPNDAFLVTFTLAAPSNVLIQSYGYGGSAGAPGGTNAAGSVIAAGGFDTYFSLFSGIGNAATFLASNDDGGCGPASPNPVCEDSRLSLSSLAAGSYTLALTLPNNFSFAENYGSGTLGDGFIGLQGDYYDAASGQVRTSAYAFDIGFGSGTTVTPEPASLLLLGTGLVSTFAFLRRRFVLSERL